MTPKHWVLFRIVSMLTFATLPIEQCKQAEYQTFEMSDFVQTFFEISTFFLGTKIGKASRTKDLGLYISKNVR